MAIDGNGVKRVRLGPAERRALIVAAAKDVFIESGFAAARAKDVAERAGITEAFLYRCFHSKEEIFQLAVEEPLLTFANLLRSDEGDSAGPIDVLGHLNRELLGSVVEIAPLVAAAVFADASRGRHIYGTMIVPVLRSAVSLLRDVALLSEIAPG